MCEGGAEYTPGGIEVPQDQVYSSCLVTAGARLSYFLDPDSRWGLLKGN